jgi:hypothetical protein
MAFSVVGTICPQFRGIAASSIVLDLNASCPAGELALVIFGGDSNTVALTSVSDSNGNTWTTTYVGSAEGNGNVGIAWSMISAGLDNSDTITIAFAESNDSHAQAYRCTGAQATAHVTGTKTYTSGVTWAHGLTTGSAGVQIEVFQFPFDWSWTPTAASWTKGGEFDDAADQTLAWFYKEVSAGTNTCTGTGTISHLAAGVVLATVTPKSDSDSLAVTLTENQTVAKFLSKVDSDSLAVTISESESLVKRGVSTDVVVIL